MISMVRANDERSASLMESILTNGRAADASPRSDWCKRGRLRTHRILSSVSLIFASVLITSCRNHVPNRIADDEYALYSAWLTNYINRRHPNRLFVARMAGGFADLVSGSCGRALHEQSDISWNLINQLQEVDDAQYPLCPYESQCKLKIQIPMPYTVVEQMPMPMSQSEAFDYVSFSRVAFNRNHCEALFFFGRCKKSRNLTHLSCADGGASAIHASKKSGQWDFQLADGCMAGY
jgi:hypothetical protein